MMEACWEEEEAGRRCPCDGGAASASGKTPAASPRSMSSCGCMACVQCAWCERGCV